MEDSQEKSKFLHKFIPIPEDDCDKKKNRGKNEKVTKMGLLLAFLLLLAWMTWITITTQGKPEQETVLENIIGDLIKRNHENTSLASLEDVRATRDIGAFFEVINVVQELVKYSKYVCQGALILHKGAQTIGEITYIGIYGSFQEEIDECKAVTEAVRKELPVLEKKIRNAKEGMTKAHEVLKYSTTNINSVVDTVDNVMKNMEKFEREVLENPAMSILVDKTIVSSGMSYGSVEQAGMSKMQLFWKAVGGLGMLDDIASLFGWGSMDIGRWILEGKAIQSVMNQVSLDADKVMDVMELCVDAFKLIKCIESHISIYTTKKEERDEAVKEKNMVLVAKKHLTDVLQGATDSTKVMYKETQRLVDHTNDFLAAFNSSCKTTIGSIHHDLSEINDNWQLIKEDLTLATTATINANALNVATTNFASMPESPWKKMLLDGQKNTAIQTMKSLFANVAEDKVIEALQSAGVDLPDEQWTEWEKEGRGGGECNCEESASCTEAWSRTCETMSCIGPEEKTVDSCKTQKESLSFFEACQSRDQIISGTCRTSQHKTILDGPVDGRYLAANVLQGECYKTCKAMPGATGCQFNCNSYTESLCHGDCFSFTERLASEEAITTMEETCYIFQNVQGTATDSILKVLLDRLEGEENFSEKTLDAWTLQMLRIDPDLVKSQENGWKKMISYQNSARDEWGQNPSSYSERKETILQPLTGQSPASLRLFEECNFASNFAYYNLMYKTTSLVWMPEDAKKALGQASAGLALGSSFFHGSHTNLGQTLDNMMIKIIAFILYETYINKLQLPDQTPDIIMTLKQEARRERTGVQMAQGITDMYRNEPVENWNQILQAIDVPRYEITFGAIIMTMSAHAKKSLMGSWTNTILLQILPMENSDKDFLKEFEPMITRALQDRAHYDIEEPDVFNKMTAGLKLMLAFVFQETVQPLNSLRSALRATGLKSINNFLTDFGTLGSIEGPPGTTAEAYPGEKRCGYSSSHAVWHTQSATGLFDLYKLVDELVRKQVERQDRMNETP